MSRRSTVVGLVVGLPVSAFFLWLAVRNADLGGVRDILGSAEPAPFALAVLGIAGVYAFQSQRWRSIASSPRVPRARFYEMVVTGVACNNVLPARLGDVLRAAWLRQEAGVPAGRAIGTVVLDRACDVGALLILLLIGLGAVARSEWAVRIAAGTAVGLLALALVVAFARVYTGRRPRGRHARGLVRRVLRDAAEALAEPIGRRRLLVWVGLSLGAWLTWSASALLVARSLDLELGLLEALFVAGVVNLGLAIPSSPGFVGTYEWLGVASLGLIGIRSEPALAFTILMHACWYVPTTLAGGLALGVRAARRLRRPRAATSST
jgi:uncharacterized protein (TIRG00374 family)